MLEEKSRAGWIESLARKRKNLFLIGGMLLLTGFIVFVYFGYRMHLDCTGFNESRLQYSAVSADKDCLGLAATTYCASCPRFRGSLAQFCYEPQ